MASCVDQSGDVDGFIVSKTKPGVGVAATAKHFPVSQEEVLHTCSTFPLKDDNLVGV